MKYSKGRGAVGPFLLRSGETDGGGCCFGLCSLQNIDSTAAQIRNLSLLRGLFLTPYEDKQVERFK